MNYMNVVSGTPVVCSAPATRVDLFRVVNLTYPKSVCYIPGQRWPAREGRSENVRRCALRALSAPNTGLRERLRYAGPAVDVCGLRAPPRGHSDPVRHSYLNEHTVADVGLPVGDDANHT